MHNKQSKTGNCVQRIQFECPESYCSRTLSTDSQWPRIMSMASLKSSIVTSALEVMFFRYSFRFPA